MKFELFNKLLDELKHIDFLKEEDELKHIEFNEIDCMIDECIVDMLNYFESADMLEESSLPQTIAISDDNRQIFIKEFIDPILTISGMKELTDDDISHLTVVSSAIYEIASLMEFKNNSQIFGELDYDKLIESVFEEYQIKDKNSTMTKVTELIDNVGLENLIPSYNDLAEMIVNFYSANDTIYLSDILQESNDHMSKKLSGMYKKLGRNARKFDRAMKYYSVKRKIKNKLLPSWNQDKDTIRKIKSPFKRMTAKIKTGKLYARNLKKISKKIFKEGKLEAISDYANVAGRDISANRELMNKLKVKGINTLGILAIISAAMYAYNRYKDGMCAGLSGDERKKCLKAAANSGYQTSMSHLKDCKYTKDPDKCKARIYKDVQKWKDKMNKYSE
jgi:hypothetical protein